ncbi:nitrate- and nitrite sensing domain-containing protein [Actinomycetospora lutea]|uniref:sensor histidine kinase n=1 Tax=Actinomycetospora lutea TaxID=663604 RepID=UPI00236612C5|nr:nitrate- and nitrite sensing domain-containing protein [Actinomycetospora lutea]MDD7942352.1 nitrate- and nitrite sensing domain-containing protein [Actinomycetospora lutea]
MAESSVPVPTANAWWSAGHWRVRTKVVAVVAVPLLLVLLLAGLAIRTQLAERGELAQVATGARLTGTVADLVDRVQTERSATAAWVAAGRPPDRSGLDVAADRTDGAVEALRAAGGEAAELDPGVRDRYATALARLDALPPLRATAVATRYPATSVVTGYTGLVDPLLGLSRDIAGAVGEPSVVRPATSLAALGRAKEQAEVQHALLLVGAITRALPVGASDVLRGAVAEQEAATAEFEAGATPAQVQLFDDTVAGPEVDQRVRILQTALLQDGTALAVDPAAWDGAASATRERMRTLESALQGELQAAADGLVARATTTAVVAIALVLLGVLAAVALAVVIARSLITPLRRLRYSALDVAERRLPDAVRELEDEGVGRDRPEDAVDPVPIHTEEEVGEVARAFDSVHREAVRLAGEQARLRTNLNALFVNLSRRSQGLVERQILLIDTLESREEDPDVLADLFRLDHLATRMRRNGENLLVLGGATPSRGAAEPLLLADVVRAAVGEVEHYQRVEVRQVPGLRVQGAAADDLTHLLAELLDNATSYSPPDTPVTVSASRAPDGGAIVEVADRGLGMDTEDLDDANARLEQPVLLDSTVPRQMGLFVVGALARRHGITARLLPGGDDGTTASVHVPADVLVAHERPRVTDDPVAAEPGDGSLTDGVRTDGARTDGAPTDEPQPEDPLTDEVPVARAPDEPIFQEMCSAWFSDTDAAIPAPRGGNASLWESTADEGWRAVAARAAEPEPTEHTAGGLPRRRRGAGLVPGGAAPPAAPSDAEPAPDDIPAPRRTVDADALRARMSQFQQGATRGREELDTDGFEVPRDGDTIETEPATAGAAGSESGGPR